MNTKLFGWIEVLIAAAFTGALNASANALATPELFQHVDATKLLIRMAAVGAILSMRDQMKQSPVPPLFPGPQAQVANNSTATAPAAQEVLHGNSDSHPANN